MRTKLRRWTACRTTASSRWNHRELARRKGRQRISVVLAARDGAATVGAILLVDTVPLVDELVVIDSGSTDAIGALAEAGARVVRRGDVLRRLGDVPGKGEAVGESLLVIDSDIVVLIDIVVFIEADLERFDGQFAVGLVGLLLQDDGGSA